MLKLQIASNCPGGLGLSSVAVPNFTHTYTLPNSTPHWCYGTYQHRLAMTCHFWQTYGFFLLWFKTPTSIFPITFSKRHSSHLLQLHLHPAAVSSHDSGGCGSNDPWWTWSLQSFSWVALGAPACQAVPAQHFLENDGKRSLGQTGDGEVPQADFPAQDLWIWYDMIWYDMYFYIHMYTRIFWISETQHVSSAPGDGWVVVMLGAWL